MKEVDDGRLERSHLLVDNLPAPREALAEERGEKELRVQRGVDLEVGGGNACKCKSQSIMVEKTD